MYVHLNKIYGRQLSPYIMWTPEIKVKQPCDCNVLTH